MRRQPQYSRGSVRQVPHSEGAVQPRASRQSIYDFHTVHNAAAVVPPAMQKVHGAAAARSPPGTLMKAGDLQGSGRGASGGRGEGRRERKRRIEEEDRASRKQKVEDRGEGGNSMSAVTQPLGKGVSSTGSGFDSPRRNSLFTLFPFSHLCSSLRTPFGRTPLPFALSLSAGFGHRRVAGGRCMTEGRGGPMAGKSR
jgi:hypothetical protein